jgi:micrococcal nuclease
MLAVLLAAAVILAVIALLGMPAEVAAPGSTGNAKPPAGAPAEVERVVDGDTVIVRIDGRRERVRYAGIDAPELGDADEGRQDECWAEDSLDAHAELVAGRQLRLVRDRTDRDRFDRLLRHAWVEMGEDWVHVGEALVGAGAALARSYPPDTGMDERLARAEGAARDARAGLWGDCAP